MPRFKMGEVVMYNDGYNRCQAQIVAAQEKEGKWVYRVFFDLTHNPVHFKEVEEYKLYPILEED